MARRHEDRKPGQRFVRVGNKASKQGGGKQAGGKQVGGGAGKRGPRTTTGGSQRRADGLVVKPSSVLGGGEAAVGDDKVRLNHFLAKAGVCSRRMADELIASGRVEVNGDVVTELGVRVDPDVDEVRFDGSRLEPEKAVYVLLNKPKGVVCTSARNEQKRRVLDLLPTIRGRIFTVGRLDMDSEGLLMVTNDGAFAQEMTHPRYGVPKLYSVVVRGRIEDGVLEKARGGVWLSEGPTGGMQLKVDRMTKERTFLKVTLREGKNREIRRVFAKLGHPVVTLKRVRIGQLTLHGLGEGDWRFLDLGEIGELRDVARSDVEDGGATNERPSRSRPSRARAAGSRVGGRRSSEERADSARSGSARSGSFSSGFGSGAGSGRSGAGRSGPGRSGASRGGKPGSASPSKPRSGGSRAGKSRGPRR